MESKGEDEWGGKGGVKGRSERGKEAGKGGGEEGGKGKGGWRGGVPDQGHPGRSALSQYADLISSYPT